jgi:hypothetical protein
MTVLMTAKSGLGTVIVNCRVPSALSRVSNATSDGEFMRVGT